MDNWMACDIIAWGMFAAIPNRLIFSLKAKIVFSFREYVWPGALTLDGFSKLCKNKRTFVRFYKELYD